MANADTVDYQPVRAGILKEESMKAWTHRVKYIENGKPVLTGLFKTKTNADNMAIYLRGKYGAATVVHEDDLILLPTEAEWPNAGNANT